MKAPQQDQFAFKYPSEDEPFIRRLGSALLRHWAELPEEMRAKIMQEAAGVWDREFHIPQISKKLDLFVKRHQARVAEVNARLQAKQNEKQAS
ncbi:hypothetical protein FHS83_001260 [Rhizomicrobium palustre]|uniref:Uncharacterized protein n=1 Tax=Rhizomicrobium palustre TaxID=189966 RepID=A0A846MY10_9PROT|nr:hypothetical protein [Rhizomicrobium palustre]NIK87942.1 hypothetical protein [Rhizomicrobium palustre]